MNVVDSSAWLEYFAGGANAQYFSAPIENTSELLVPTMCLFEVFKRFLIQYSQKDALDVVTVMQRGQVIDVNADVALKAAGLSVELHLPMADSIILATARAHNATLWTQDTDFKDLPGVRFKAHTSQR